jgi:hypothetical protein
VQEQVHGMRERLDALQAAVEECRAALDTVAEGDPTAASELDRQVELMAEHVAALKAVTGAAPPAAG